MENNINIDFSSMGSFDMIKIMELVAEHGPKIKAFIPKIVEFLPKIKEWEKAQQLQPNEIIMYGAITTNTSVFIYVNKVKKNQAGETVITEQLHRLDLMELINKGLTYLPV